MLKSFILILISIIPVIILLKFTFDKDKIEKEPLSLLFRLFMMGSLSAVIVLFLSKSLTSLISIDNNFYTSFVEISLIEEICKWISIYVITWKHKDFDYKFDAIVYSIFVSLGFALVENIGYSIHYGITTALLRAVISVPGHCFFAIYMGYYLGLAKMYYSKNQRKNGSNYAIYSILVPTALHGIYNFCLGGENDALYVLFLIFVIMLYILSFKTINMSSRMDMAFKKKIMR